MAIDHECDLHMLLRACYAVSGTDLAYGATRTLVATAFLSRFRSSSLTCVCTHPPRYRPTHSLCDVRTDTGYAAMRCPVLRYAMLLPGVFRVHFYLGDDSQGPRPRPRQVPSSYLAPT
eukprot:833436-Rhodomonas_salina.1